MTNNEQQNANTGNNDDPETVDVVEVDDSGCEVIAIDADPTARRKRGGRTTDSVWDLFTECFQPQKAMSAVCKHCKVSCVYQRKSERVRSHLLKCKPFIKSMLSVPTDDQPQWFLDRQPAKRSRPGSAAVSKTTQSSIQDFMLPKMSKKEQEGVKQCIAMHYYVSGTSFVRVEEPHLRKAFQMCRPDVVMPDRKQLAGPLLDKCYEKIKIQLDDRLQNAKSSFFSLTTDGWSNIKNEPIINYMMIGGNLSLFLESVSTGEIGHTAQMISDDLSRVIEEQTSKGIKICGAVTDNTSGNKSAWKLLQLKYPTMFFQGCACHGLNLLVKDIFAATKAKRGRLAADYPENYPFEYLLNFANQCKDIVSFFSYHHQHKARLVKEQVAQKLPALVQPATTRWGSLQSCFVSLLKSESILHSMVTARDFLSGSTRLKASAQKVYEIITQDTFLQNLQKSIAILEPINQAIVRFQSDTVPVSEIYRCFQVDLTQSFASLDCLEQSERTYLSDLLESRMHFIYGDAIGIAYLLDPRFLGHGMPMATKKKVEDLLFEYASDHKEQLFLEYTRFVINACNDKEQGDFRFQMLLKQTKTILQYWMIDGSEYPMLKEIALKVFSMVTSSAASERNFSTTGFIHSKLRNLLKESSVRKLVYIKTNAPQIGDSKAQPPSSESEDDDDMDDASSVHITD